MNAQEAIAAITNGKLVDCTHEEYENEVRTALGLKSGELIDNGDFPRATIIMEEIKRLDAKFDQI